METSEELNKELREEVNKIFADLAKEIGSNRQQLANKVLSHHKEINKELTKSKVDDERKKGILSEVSRIVKMAGQQLPHLKMHAPKPVTAQASIEASNKVAVPQSKVAAPPAKVAAAVSKVAAPPSKKSAPPAKKKAAPAKKVTPKAKKKK